MTLTPEQIQTLLAAAGVLGPHFLTRAQPNNGLAVVLGSIPCTAPKGYVFDVLITARNPANGQIATNRRRISVHGDPVAPAAVAPGDVVTWATATDMANPPTFALAVAGTVMQISVTNPIAGAAVDVEAIVFGPYISN